LNSLSEKDLVKAKRAILVSGSHRSGSTWVGRMIASSSEVGYIHEPFNLKHRPGVNSYQFDKWFPYVDDCSKPLLLEKSLAQCLSFNYQWMEEFKSLRSVRDIARMFRDGFLFSYYKLKGNRALIKDPIAIFNIEWLVEKYEIMPVILIRHPAAFVSSLKKAGWEFPFQDLLEQPLLMRKLEVFRMDIENMSYQQDVPIVKQGILLWNIIHFIISDYKVKQPRWYFCRHEDLSRNPVEEFQKIYEYLGLDYTEKAQHNVIKSSSNTNKSEAHRPSDTVVDSKKNISSWKKRLTSEEVVKIKEGTREIWKGFYAENDWI